MPGILGSGRRRDTAEKASGSAASAWQAGLQMPDCDPRAVQGGHGGRRVQCQAHDIVRLQPAESYIRDEVARRHTLRYIRVPERTVKLFPAAREKTTKLYILDVKPRSPAVKEPEVLSCYGVEGGQRTLPEEFGAYELRQKFAKRPCRLSNANVAQPEADMDVIVGVDNPYLMPTVVSVMAKIYL